MKKSLYICNATNPAMGNTHTTNTAKYSVFSGVTSVIRCGFVAKLIQGVRSLFVHTNAKLVTQMRQTDKQATQAKNSNLAQIFRTALVGTLGALSLPLIVNGSDWVIINIAGIASLALAGYLYHRWNVDTKNYTNEYYHNDVR